MGPGPWGLCMIGTAGGIPGEGGGGPLGLRYILQVGGAELSDCWSRVSISHGSADPPPLPPPSLSQS